MMCMSPAATAGIITKLSIHYDERVLHWVNELKIVCLLVRKMTSNYKIFVLEKFICATIIVISRQLNIRDAIRR